MGAQAGADYLEPDLVFSKDGALVVLHEVELSHATDVASRPEFANRSRTITDIFWRGDPNNVTDGQPASINNDLEDITGWFVHDFTLSELKTLKRRSTEHPDDSPFNGLWSVMTFNESLELTNNLSATLGRDIGIIPETKYPEWYRSLGFERMELLMLESLRAYGFVHFDDADGFYKAELMADNKPAVIVQSFAAESLLRLNALANEKVPAMYLLWTTDIDAEEGVERSTMEWILGFSHNIGCSQARVTHLVNARNEFDGLDDFEIGVYTLVDNVTEYVKWIDMGLDSIFTDDVSTGRVAKQMLTDLTEGDELLSSFGESESESASGQGAATATIVLFCAAVCALF